MKAAATLMYKNRSIKKVVENPKDDDKEQKASQLQKTKK